MDFTKQPKTNDNRPTNWVLITAGIAMFVAAITIEIYPGTSKPTNIATTTDASSAEPVPLNF